MNFNNTIIQVADLAPLCTSDETMSSTFNGCAIHGDADTRMWMSMSKFNGSKFDPKCEGVITDFDPIDRAGNAIKPGFVLLNGATFNGCMFFGVTCLFPLAFESMKHTVGIANWRHEDAPVDGNPLVGVPGV